MEPRGRAIFGKISLFLRVMVEHILCFPYTKPSFHLGWSWMTTFGRRSGVHTQIYVFLLIDTAPPCRTVNSTEALGLLACRRRRGRGGWSKMR